MREKNISNAVNLSESLEILSKPIDLYILFIDLCNSTSIKQFCIDSEIPDSIWIMRQKVFLSRTAKIVSQYNGKIIKTIGDEIMATFSKDIEAGNIIKCVIEVFQTFENLKSYNKGQFKIKSKAMIDFGTCYDGQLLNQDIVDPIGTAVDRCARIGIEVSENEIGFSDDFNLKLVAQKYPLKKLNVTTEQKPMKGLGLINFYKIAID